MDNVKVTLHLSAEAAGILHDYAGERNRGFFVSQLLVAQRRLDDAEGQRIAAEAAAQRAVKAVEAATRAREKYSIPNPGKSSRKGR